MSLEPGLGWISRDFFAGTLLPTLVAVLPRFPEDEAQAYLTRLGAAFGEFFEELARSSGVLSTPMGSTRELGDLLASLKWEIGDGSSAVRVEPASVSLRGDRCHFGEAVVGYPWLCTICSGAFGTVAARNFGYAKVAIPQSIAQGHPHCNVQVFIRQTAQAQRTQGLEFGPSRQVLPSVEGTARLIGDLPRTGSLREALPHMARLVCAALPYDHIGISLVDREGQVTSSATTIPDLAPTHRRRGAPRRLQRVARSARPIVLRRLTPANASTALRKAGVRSMVMVPLRRGDTVIGLLAGFSYRESAFGVSDVYRMEDLAVHLGNAVEAVRSFEREQRLRRALELVHRVTSGGSSSTAADEWIQELVSAARELVDARYAALDLLDGQGQSRKYTSVGISEKTMRAIGGPPSGRGLLGFLRRQPGPVRLRRIQDHPLFSGFPPHHPRMTSFLGTPVRFEGRVLANLYFADKVDAAEFTDQDEAIVAVLANHIALSLHRYFLMQQMEEHNRRLRILREIAHGLAASLDRDDILRLILQGAGRLVAHDRASVVLYDAVTGRFTVPAASQHPPSSPVPADITLSPEESSTLLGVVQSGRSATFSLSPDTPGLAGRLYHEGIRSYVCIPISDGTRSVGSLNVGSTRKDAFGPEAITALEALAPHIAVALKNADLVAKLQSSRDDLRLLTQRLTEAMTLERRARIDAISMLATAAEAKDMETATHLRRVRDYSIAIAREIGLSNTQVEEIGYSSLLHDIGKVHVPDAVLLNPGHFDAADWDAMRGHTISGERILGGHPFFDMARQIARGHHERWDGSGYPDGLRGEQIPLAARIVAVADVFDALVTPRSYKPAWPPAAATEEIRRLAGIHFDPELVSAFDRLWQRGIALAIAQGGHTL